MPTISMFYGILLAMYALTRANPTRLNYLKIFPNSNWEFRRWNREDWMGVVGSCIAVVSVIVLLIFIVSLGS